MTETPISVAEYSYDKQGRLRAEWDPRIPTALKTIYGYDEEGHVTALTPPGQESWAFTYGTLADDAGTGRLIKVTRASASSGLWGGVLPSNTEAPKITGTPVVGVRMSVSLGKWNNGPVAYSYQWMDCKNAKGSCTTIPGAVSPNYTPANTDVYHRLAVKVSATNGGGSVATTTAETTARVWGTPQVAYSLKFGSYGTENGEFEQPKDMVIAENGDIWVLDTGNERLEELKETSGKLEFMRAVALYKTYEGEVFSARQIAVSKGDIWVGGPGCGEGRCNPVLRKFTEEGKELSYVVIGEITGKAFAQQLETLTTDSKGNVWFTAEYGRDSTEACTVNEYKPLSGEYIHGKPTQSWSKCKSEEGSVERAEGIAVNSEEHVFVSVDSENGGIKEFTETGEYIKRFGGREEEPLGKETYDRTGGDLTLDSKGHLWSEYGGHGCSLGEKGSESFSGCVTEWTTSGELLLETPETEGRPGYSIAVDSKGDLWGTYEPTVEKSKTKCNEESQCREEKEKCDKEVKCEEKLFEYESAIEKFAPGTTTEGKAVAPGPGTTIDYHVPVSGTGAPHNMTAAEVEKWGQKAEEAPEEATAIFPPDSPQGWPASNYARAIVYYLDHEGRLVNTATPSTGTYGSISTTEYNETNDVVRTLSPDNRATALEAGTKSEEVANLLSTFNTYKNKCSKESEFNEERESTDSGTRLCETEGPAHAVKYMAGKEQKEAPYARSHVRYFYDEKIPSEGPNKESFATQTFDLITESKSLTEIVNSKGSVEQEVEPRTTITSYSGQNNLGWKLREPTSVIDAAESEGAKVTHTTLYYEAGNEAMGQVMETRGPEGSAGNSAHDEKTIYYSAEENKEYPMCGKHPEWAGLVCKTLPAKQPPETTGVPKLPETTTTYNMWDEPETIVETFPKTATFAEKTRTTKEEYDAAGRMKSSEETSTASTESTDKALPMVTEEYSSTTGVLEKQSTTVGGKTKTITSVYNTLGQLETYTDADGNVAKFKYGTPEEDGLLEEMSDSSDENNSSQKYTYNGTTKQLEKLVDSSVGTFTASYDTAGKLASEAYPNGMCANYTNNSVGETTHIEYTKTSSCSGKEGVWFSETKVPSVRGETMSRTSTLASENYTYDTLGRLTEVQETPVGEYCKTRIYAYDEESNRAKLTTREPNSKKECATEGGTEEIHTYDEANRLTDSGIAYDPLGNVTKLPSGDTEGHALESTFYVDNAVATQTQNGVTNDYYMDPDGRMRETITGAKKVISHYDGSGEAVAWTCEGAEKAETCESSGNWTRDIPGIDGTLTATQKGTGAVTETAILQLHDLQGDVVATIKDKAGETKLESTYNSTEFGVPSGGKEPPKFAWLGAGDVEKSLASGVITEGATSYVPQTGRTLQSEEVAPPGLPNGAGAGAPYIFQEEPWVLQGATREADEAPGLEAGREKEAMAAALAACAASTTCGVDPQSTKYLSKGQTEGLLKELEAAGPIADGFISIIGTLVDADLVFSAVSIALDTDEEFLEEDLGECLGEFEAQYHPSCRLTIWYVEATVEYFPLETASENIFYGKFSVLTCYHLPHHNPKECVTTPGTWGYRHEQGVSI